jgi:hypothetical protein
MSTEQLTTMIALAAVLIARRGVARVAGRSAIAARLCTLHTLLALLLALRLLATVVAAAPVTAALMLVSSWLPMAGLHLTEELRRRHAPRSVKLATLGGAIVFSVIALSGAWSKTSYLGLAGYQAAITTVMVFLLWRSRRDIAPAECRTADTFLLALALTIPLAVSDFPAVIPDMPVRGGIFAVLILLLGSARLASGYGTPRQLLGDLVLVAGAGGLTLFAVRISHPAASPEAAAGLAGVGAALAALLLVIERATQLRLRGAGMIAGLARVADGSVEAIIASHPLLSSGRLIGPTELASYPASSLSRLAGYRVISAEIADPQARDMARDLLDAAMATHLLWLSRDPIGFLAISTGGLAAPGLDDELEIAARLLEKA